MAKRILILLALASMTLGISGCLAAAAGAAGAAGGYHARDEGYKVQSPIKKH